MHLTGLYQVAFLSTWKQSSGFATFPFLKALTSVSVTTLILSTGNDPRSLVCKWAIRINNTNQLSYFWRYNTFSFFLYSRPSLFSMQNLSWNFNFLRLFSFLMCFPLCLFSRKPFMYTVPSLFSGRLSLCLSAMITHCYFDFWVLYSYLLLYSILCLRS